MFTDTVKQAAVGQWDTLLQNIGGLNKAETMPGRKGMPCPHCGGTDRYEFKSIEDGFYMCRGCGAGDGWSMLQKRLGVDFRGAVEQVAQHLHLTQKKYNESVKSTTKPEAEVIRQNTAITNNTALKAQSIWNQSYPATREQPYLKKKRLPSYKLRTYKGTLVSALYDTGYALVNLQFIEPDSKRFLKGGQTKGCFQWWHPFTGGPTWSVYICEGVADALSTFSYLEELRTVICAYSASNMVEVAKHFRQTRPEHRLIGVLDNDRAKASRRWRPGIAVLQSHHCFNDIILPPEGMDASDIWVNHHD